MFVEAVERLKFDSRYRRLVSARPLSIVHTDGWSGVGPRPFSIVGSDG